MSKLHLFGIRHHGPGSSLSLLAALAQLQPDIILIEGPPDANPLIQQSHQFELHPPIALLLYDPKASQQAAYYPFASFSPEWQAIRFAYQQEIPIQFMDMPQSMQRETQQQMEKSPELLGEQSPIRKDPLGYIAQLAGYEDGERWWEIMMERQANEQEMFDLIAEMLGDLRAEVKQESLLTLRREAYMRKIIRKAMKEGYEKIAVVCGAYHLPALQTFPSVSHDNQLLKGLRHKKWTATWIPWTYERLAQASGYAAGVLSPAWYEMLFQDQAQVSIRWMTEVAHLFRKQDMDASSAHVIEGVRLAETLARIRALEVPGIEELYEAAITIFCGGQSKPMELIQKELIEGNRMGEVREHKDIPIIPLQKDLHKQQKGLLKPQAQEKTIELDLRKESHLKYSRLLHRLRLLKLQWGSLLDKSGKELGSFSEKWKLKWQPELNIQVIEAGIWGNTVEAASTNYVLHHCQNPSKLMELIRLMEDVLFADLPHLIEHLGKKLQEVSALTTDVSDLIQAVEPMVNIARYSDVRQTDVLQVQHVLDEMIPRVLISLAAACLNLNEQAARERFEHLHSMHRALSLLNDEKWLIEWKRILQKLLDIQAIAPILRGLSSRFLFDLEELSEEEGARYMSYSLSASVPALEAANWLEGFLSGSGLLLLHYRALWNLVDDWILGLSNERFREVLPLLRRSFASFSAAERRKMGEIAAKHQQQQPKTDSMTLDKKRSELILPSLRMLLGI